MLTPWRITARPSRSVIQRPAWSSGSVGAAVAGVGAAAARSASAARVGSRRLMARETYLAACGGVEVETPHGPARVQVDGAPAERALVLGHGAGGGVGAPDLQAAA